jgi:hypothetical protein
MAVLWLEMMTMAQHLWKFARHPPPGGTSSWWLSPAQETVHPKKSFHKSCFFTASRSAEF